MKPILSESGAGRVGTLIYMEDKSTPKTLQRNCEENTNEELETTKNSRVVQAFRPAIID